MNRNMCGAEVITLWGVLPGGHHQQNMFYKIDEGYDIIIIIIILSVVPLGT
jgi:hypothetical protein